jgi:protein-export membrane protein SecD
MVEGQYVVSFKLTSAGTTKFAAATQQFIGKTISIYVDDQEISSPTVNTVIANGSGMIQGNFTRESATELATQIESGAIPLTLSELEVSTISASLGADVLTRSIFAGLIGTVLVMLFMIAMYRVSGLMADVALGFYVIILFFAILTMPGVQLTLAGIAGVILSIGMAVDANVIIFERFRDELRRGKPIENAMEAGFKRAFNAIFDSHVTMLIAAFVLIVFGAGSVKGFAYTLAIGAGVSLFSAYTITRFLLRRIVRLNVFNKKWLVRV